MVAWQFEHDDHTPPRQEPPLPDQTEITAARDDVQRARDRIHDTVAELEERVAAPARAVKQRLDVGELVRDHPWSALAVAVSAGAIVAASGADRRATAVAVQKAKQGGAASVRALRAAPAKSREVVSSGRGAVGGALDALGARVALSLIERLRGPRVTPLPPEPQTGLGFVDHTAPAHEPTV
jgi:hypothetical protein